jgi:hypothetical protein
MTLDLLNTAHGPPDPALPSQPGLVQIRQHPYNRHALAKLFGHKTEARQGSVESLIDTDAVHQLAALTIGARLAVADA